MAIDPERIGVPDGWSVVPPKVAPTEADGSAWDVGQNAAITGAGVAARAIPAAVKSAAGAVSGSQPLVRAVQRAVPLVGAAVGGAIGEGVPGGVLPGAYLGKTVGEAIMPTQATVRSVADRLAGNAPTAPTAAAEKAQSIINYAKRMGIKVDATAIVDDPTAGSAVQNYAQSLGKRVVQLFGPDNRVISGPQAVVEAAKPAASVPGLLSRAVSWLGMVGAGLSAMGAEGETLKRLNDPKTLYDAFAPHLPVEKQKDFATFLGLKDSK